jgi:YggT family protein
MIPLATTQEDIAKYVDALFAVYVVLIFVRILMSWIPRIPRSATLRPVLDFITETTDPYLNLFRRFIPPIGGGGMTMDVSPIIAIIVLLVAERIVVGAIINP